MGNLDKWNGRAWAEIDTAALVHNVKEIRSKLAPGCRLLYVIKADAYGCGASEVSSLVDRYTDMYGVATADEAFELRKNGIVKPILVLGCTPLSSIKEAAEQNVTISVFSEEYAASVAALLRDKRLKAHIMIDSGMSRLGFYCHDAATCENSLHEIGHMCDKYGEQLDFEGIFTHFAVSDSLRQEDIAFTAAQYKNFRYVTDRLSDYGVKGLIRHCANSAATLNNPEMHLDMVRPGLILYGCLPTGLKKVPDIRPAVSVKATISQLRTLKAGDSVGYGRAFVAENEKLIATVPLGYADGLSRVLSGKFTVLCNGMEAPSVGNICMDQFGCDVTGIPGAEAGQTVTLLGKDGNAEITADRLGAAMGTISYEILTNIGRRLPRIYF